MAIGRGRRGEEERGGIGGGGGGGGGGGEERERERERERETYITVVLYNVIIFLYLHIVAVQYSADKRTSMKIYQNFSTMALGREATLPTGKMVNPHDTHTHIHSNHPIHCTAILRCTPH